MCEIPTRLCDIKKIKNKTANVIIHTFKHMPQARFLRHTPQKAAQPYLLRHDNDLFPS